MTNIYREGDADPRHLEGATVAVVGYGNQGRAQALNLRDSGLRVVIGNIDDEYRANAASDGFTVFPIADAAGQANVVMLLLPDEIAPEIFERDIRPKLARRSMLVFASGYNVAYGHIKPPDNVDVVLLAPRMIGTGVRDLFLAKEGFYSFVGVEQDATGDAKSKLLALAHGVGTLKKGAVETTFRMEAELDLFNEQAFGPAFGRVLLTAINTLIEAGYPSEVVLLEMYLSGELGYIFREMADTGLIRQLDHHSQTSQYGAISRGIKFLGVDVATPMKNILANIQEGNFAREWNFEQRTGKLRYRLLKYCALRQPINRIEKTVRRFLGYQA